MPSSAVKALKFAVLLVFICACWAAQGPATRPVAPPAEDSDTAQLVADTQHAIDQWRDLPLLAPCSINQVVHFSECQGILVAEWPILHSSSSQQAVSGADGHRPNLPAASDDPVQGRISLTDLPGHAVVRCVVGHPPVSLIAPMFEYYEMIMPEGECRHLQVLNSATHLTVVQDMENARTHRLQTISLIENLDPNATDVITLRVQTLQDNQPSENTVVSAPTLSTLRRQYPYEFEKYLRPLFHEFRQDDSVFAVEDRVGWQIMSAEWHAPADMQSRIDPLLAELNSSSYSQRQAGQQALEKMGEPAALYLRSADRSKWSAEQKSRVNKLLSDFFPLGEEQAAQLGRDVNFLLDCLASDDPALRAATIEHLQRLTGTKIQVDLDEPPLQRLSAITRLRHQLLPQSAARDASN